VRPDWRDLDQVTFGDEVDDVAGRILCPPIDRAGWGVILRAIAVVIYAVSVDLWAPRVHGEIVVVAIGAGRTEKQIVVNVAVAGRVGAGMNVERGTRERLTVRDENFDAVAV